MKHVNFGEKCKSDTMPGIARFSKNMMDEQTNERMMNKKNFISVATKHRINKNAYEVKKCGEMA